MAPWLCTYRSYQGRECSTRPCHGSGYAHSALEHSQLTYGDAIGMSGMQLLRCWYCAIPGPCPTPLVRAGPSLVPSPLSAAILQWPERWSGTFARYLIPALGRLPKSWQAPPCLAICNLAASFAHLRESYLGIQSNEIKLYPILPLSQF